MNPDRLSLLDTGQGPRLTLGYKWVGELDKGFLAQTPALSIGHKAFDVRFQLRGSEMLSKPWPASCSSRFESVVSFL